MRREEIREIYAQGEEAVFGVVELLAKKIEKLEERVKELENQLSKNSQNSHKPPSGDGFGKKTKSLRVKSKRASGGQKGHKGETLEWKEKADRVIEHRVEKCEACGESLEEEQVIATRARQVYELPEIQVEVIEHRVEQKRCPKCEKVNSGRFPEEVKSVVQYGANMKGVMVYLMEGQLLASQRVQELLEEVMNCHVSEGTLYNVREECYEQLASVEAQVKQQVQAAEVSHFDETGLRVKGKLMWLHVASTAELTYYFLHEKRGQLAMDEMGILPQFKGRAIHDGLSSYRKYDDCQHGLCNAHHLRELQFVEERYQQPWATQMIELLIAIKTQVETAQAQHNTELTPAQINDFEQQYRDILNQGFAANPPPAVDEFTPPTKGRPKQSPPKNLLDRLQAYQAWVLAFMHDFRVPFDNNQAERDLRMMKLKQKISGGFRSMSGARMFCRIRGYISTLRKQGIPVLNSLRQTLRGNPDLPLPQPE